MPRMTFYTNTDGNIHVQNAVAGMLGQHHVHTPEGFARWRTDTDRIVEGRGLLSCPCGLEPGQAKGGVSGKVTALSPEYR